MSKVATYPVVLTSRRLLLRPLKIADAAGLARMTNDPLVTRNLLKTAMPFTTADARELILRARKKKSPVWAIDTGQLVGLIGLAGEFGYWLGRSAWGRGFAFEAARLVINHAFECLEIDTLHASPIADNKASRHLLERLGFERNGVARAFCCQRSKVVPLIRYKLERLTWEKAQSRDRS
ncbi:MAG: GNAT family N-acetyltransferase [Agrobacterium cavarae]